jgi:uncharacterized protein (TIGR00251 family)
MARRISVTVKPSARRAVVTKISDSEFQVAVMAPARDGRANAALIEALAEYFAVPKSVVKILHGDHARRKLVEIAR